MLETLQYVFVCELLVAKAVIDNLSCNIIHTKALIASGPVPFLFAAHVQYPKAYFPVGALLQKLHTTSVLEIHILLLAQHAQIVVPFYSGE